MMVVLYNAELARRKEFKAVRQALLRRAESMMQPFDEQEQPSSRFIQSLRTQQSSLIVYGFCTSLLDMQTVLNEGGFGIFIAGTDEWEEQKVHEMNTTQKTIVSSLDQALSVIVARETASSSK